MQEREGGLLIEKMEHVLGRKRHLVRAWVFSEKQNSNVQKKGQGSKELKEVLR